MKKLTIAYANTAYKKSSPHGGNAHINQFIKNAAKQGHEVWTLTKNEHPDAKSFPGGRLKKYLILRSCDAIIFRIEGPTPTSFELFRPLTRNLVNIPVTVWEFNTIPGFQSLTGKTKNQIDISINKFRKYAPFCDVAICVSNNLSEYVRNIIGVKNVVTLPNGSDPDIFRPGLEPFERIKMMRSNLNIVWMGSGGLGWTDFELIRNAAKKLWLDGYSEKIKFHILGHGLPSLKDMPPNVIYHGSDFYENIPYWLAGMDVGLISYLPGPADFGSPLKLFDYMASGLAIVSTDQPQVRDILNNIGQSEFIVKNNKTDSLVKILKMLENNPELVRQQGLIMRRLVLEKYNWEKIVKETIFEIQKVIK